MSDTIKITTYLCDKDISAISFKDKDQFEISITDPTDTANGIVKTVLSRNGKEAEGTITARMLKNGDSFSCEAYQNIHVNYPEIYYQYPSIVYKLPVSCNWIKALVNVLGFSICQPDGCFFSKTVPEYSIGGMIPIDDSRDKSKVFGNEAEIYTELNQNLIAPGQKIILDYYYLINDVIIVLRAGQVFYDTPKLTSGIVTQVYGDPQKDVNCTFDVYGYFGEDEEQTINCKRTDWVEWEIGDYVYVLRDLNIICPMQVGNYYDGSM